MFHLQSTLKLFALVVFFLVGFAASIVLGIGAFDGQLLSELFTFSKAFKSNGANLALQGDGSADDEGTDPIDPYFPNALHIRNGGDLIGVPHAEELLPSNTSHFAVFTWFKLKRQLKEGETVVVLSKQVGTPGQETGYGLGLTKRGDLLRPAVFWRDSTGKGGGYLFTELSAPEGSWIMLLVGSIPEKSAIVVHSNVLRSDGSVKSSFHGSHEFSEFLLPDSDADLSVGSKRIGTFRGFVGSFGIFQGENLQDTLPALRDALGESPLELPDVLPRDVVKLFVADGMSDISSLQHAVFKKGFSSKDQDQRGGRGDGTKKRPKQAE